MPTMHFTPPKMPAMHFTPPKMPKMQNSGAGKTSQMQFEQAMMAHMNMHSHQSGSAAFASHTAHHASQSHSGQHSNSLAAKSNGKNMGSVAAAAATGVLGAGLGAGLVAAHPGVSRNHGYGRRYGSYWGRHYYRRRRYYPNQNSMTLAQRNLLRLVRDLDSLTPRGRFTQVQRTMLKNDLMAVTDRPPRPSTPPVQDLANHLVNGLTGRRSPMINTQELAGDLKMVMNCANLAPANTSQAIADSQAVLRTGGVNQGHVQSITSDLKAIVASAPAQNNAVVQAQGLLGRPN